MSETTITFQVRGAFADALIIAQRELKKAWEKADAESGETTKVTMGGLIETALNAKLGELASGAPEGVQEQFSAISLRINDDPQDYEYVRQVRQQEDEYDEYGPLQVVRD